MTVKGATIRAESLAVAPEKIEPESRRRLLNSLRRFEVAQAKAGRA